MLQNRTPDGKSLFACSQDGTVACLQLDAELIDVAPDDAVYKELIKYGYGRKKTQLPESPLQLELEEDNAIVVKASTSKRIVDLMKGNTSIESSSSPKPIIDITMTEAEPITTNGNKTNDISSLSSASSAVLEQKVSIAKNGKKRIQPMMLSPSASATTSAQRTVASVNNTQRTFSTTSSNTSALQEMEYDDPILPSQGVGSAVVGNKRKVEDLASSEENEVDGNKLSRVKPVWIDSAVAPPVVQKSVVKMGLPKVKSILSAKVRPDDPSVVMECHNAPSNNSKLKNIEKRNFV